MLVSILESCDLNPINVFVYSNPIEFDGFGNYSRSHCAPTCEKLYNVGVEGQITGSDNEIFSIIGHSPCEKPHFFTPNGL